MLPELRSILRVSYEQLETEQKEIFLDIAIFFYGENSQTITRVLDEEAEDFSYHLQILERKCMIKLGCSRVGMHDLFRELGRAIVDEECPKYPGRRSRLWRPSDVKEVLQNFTGTESVRGLSLVSGETVLWNEDEFGNRCAWNTDSFANMKELKLLVLKDDCLQGDFGKLSQKLLFLRWRNFPYDHMPVDLHMKHIRILDVDGGKLMNLWNDQSQFPLNLRELNMHNCDFLNKVPESMAKCTGLQKVDFSSCILLKTISEEFCYLEALEDLNLSYCRKLKFLPLGIGRMKRLRFLHLRDCINLKVLPESFGQLPQLQRLDMNGCKNVDILEGSFGNISTLRTVEMVNCGKFELVPSGLTRQRSLMHLSLGNALKTFRVGFHHGFSPNDIGDFRELIQLHLYGISNLRKLPQSIGGGRKSSSVYCQTVFFEEFALVRVKVVDLGHLKNLRQLSLSGCSGLQHISGFCTSRNLSYLDLSGCHNLVKILDLHEIKQLSTLNIHVSEALSSENYLWLENLRTIDNVFFTASAIPYVTPIVNPSYIEATSVGQELRFQLLPTKKSSVRVYVQKKPLKSSARVYLKEGWIRRIGEGEEYMIHNICNAFFKEIRRQRLLSDAREHAPSQLNLANLHALDIANCRIQRLRMLDGTPIQVEEMELVYKSKQLLWGNDRVLKHLDLSIMDTNLPCTIKSMANFYKMEVMISSRGKVVHKDELQEYDKDTLVNKHDEISIQVFRNVLKSRELLRNEIKFKRNKRGKKRENKLTSKGNRGGKKKKELIATGCCC
eukprot:Gb_25612 [translate_table: standard]